jgi:hypothetical protein
VEAVWYKQTQVVIHKALIKVIKKKMINDKKLAAAVNDDDNEQSKKVSWWINELYSLGTEKTNIKSESKNSQELEDLTDDIKQSFIHDYKTCYGDNIQR